MVHRARARAGQPGVLQEGIRPPVGQGDAARALGPAACPCRTRRRRSSHCRYLLPHASPVLRKDADKTLWSSARRAEQRRGGLDQDEDLRRDRRRGQVARLDADRGRHQRQRQARRVRRAERAGRSREGQARHGGLLRDHAEPGGRLGVGPDHGPGLRAHGAARLHRAPHPGRESVRDLDRRAFVPPDGASARAAST